jgi:large subunit ribosomal protein L23
MEAYQIIRRPVVTEKSNRLKEAGNKYTFEVHPDANKTEIKKAIEELFKVKVLNVNTVRLPGKEKRFGMNLSKLSDRKKAVATVRQGDRIEFFEGA